MLQVVCEVVCQRFWFHSTLMTVLVEVIKECWVEVTTLGVC